MALTDLESGIAQDSLTWKIATPNGVMFVTVVESIDYRKRPVPINILITIGKSGSAIMAWATMTADLISLMFTKKIDLAEIIAEISMNLSDRSVMQKPGVHIRSEPEGIKYALLRYQEDRNRRLEAMK
ncbi:hypothetical protein LCGC14_1442490 [marine sediment metagenome]|uniref:ribonucleoside-diphosphate reductase n=1 Tax=marine sediment metagenome TaxID=412755 RepID=A0A0F9M955_9ZZZZ